MTTSATATLSTSAPATAAVSAVFFDHPVGMMSDDVAFPESSSSHEPLGGSPESSHYPHSSSSSSSSSSLLSPLQQLRVDSGAGYAGDPPVDKTYILTLTDIPTHAYNPFTYIPSLIDFILSYILSPHIY